MAYWCHIAGSTLAHVMVWCLVAPNYYRNRCWFIIWGPCGINIRAVSQRRVIMTILTIGLSLTFTLPLVAGCCSLSADVIIEISVSKQLVELGGSFEFRCKVTNKKPDDLTQIIKTKMELFYDTQVEVMSNLIVDRTLFGKWCVYGTESCSSVGNDKEFFVYSISSDLERNVKSATIALRASEAFVIFYRHFKDL